jgi:hypothetical protein
MRPTLLVQAVLIASLTFATPALPVALTFEGDFPARFTVKAPGYMGHLHIKFDSGRTVME